MSNLDLKTPDTNNEKSNEELPTSHTEVAGAKSRLCLMCETAFDSEWAGERICRKCKSSTKWRSG